MKQIEKEMVALLCKMREKYDLIGVKGEFEAEGARLEEFLRLKEMVSMAGVEMIVKIGGCEAITDMRQARDIGVNHIVAPMIESAFAAKKFLSAAQVIFQKDELEDVGMLLNVETIDGVRNFDKICDLSEDSLIEGLCIGRVDMACSMGLTGEDCNSPEVFEACKIICGKWRQKFPEKSCTIGGILNKESIKFLEAMPKEYGIGCESKKTVFSSKVVQEGLLREAFLDAIRFESMWYQRQMEDYRWLSDSNWNYFKALPQYEEKLLA